MENIGKGLFLLLLAATLAFSGGCKPSADQNPANHSSALIVPTSAESVKYVKFNGMDEVKCKLQSDFPALQVIEEITKKLADQGWQPLKDDYLNPGLPTSIVRGWSEFTDGTKSPPQTVHRWMTDWSNKNQEIVRYSLRYEYRNGGDKELKSLKVHAIYIPAHIVKANKEQVANYQKQPSRQK